MHVARRITPELRVLIDHYADRAIANDGAEEITGHDLMIVSDTAAVELFRDGARVDTLVVRRPYGRTAHVFALVDSKV